MTTGPSITIGPAGLRVIVTVGIVSVVSMQRNIGPEDGRAGILGCEPDSGRTETERLILQGMKLVYGGSQGSGNPPGGHQRLCHAMP
jgi:hypothetical protein